MKIEDCRLCKSKNIKKVIDLGSHPLSDTFLPPEILYGAEVFYPLELGLCDDCGHVFTMFSTSAVDRYQKQDYSYDSSNSQVSIDHFKEFSDAVERVKLLNSGSIIADIGSNVGTLLGHFQSKGFLNVVGIEPSKNIAKIAKSSGISTINDFFGPSVVDELQNIGPIDVMLSANVLNHSDDIALLLTTVRNVLSNDGIFVFEVPYLLDLINDTAFDTIYHEHVHYYGIKPLAKILLKAGFEIFDVEKIDYMCGSIRVYSRLGSNHSNIVNSMIEIEENANLYDPSTYDKFMSKVRKLKIEVMSDLISIKLKGGKIIGIGAATKGNTFLNYCRLDSDIISYIADASQLKIGKMTPGSHIKIISDDQIEKAVTHAIILPWNIANLLKKKLKHLELECYVPKM